MSILRGKESQKMAKKRKKYTVEELWNPQIDLRFGAAAYGRQSTKEQCIVCREKGDKYNKLIPYLPHAKIIKELVKKVLEEGLSEVARQDAKNPIIFPDFEDGIESGHRALDKVEGGYILKSRFGLERLLKSPANIGDLKYGDKNEYP